MGDGRLITSVISNVLLSVAQIVGGVASGSLSLIADSLHNLNDAASLGIALIARRIAREPANRRRTFGHYRAEIIGALINLTTLVIVGLYLIYQAVLRYFQETAVNGWIIVVVAGIALAVDVATALLTYAMSKRSLNIKAAFVHNVADSLASVGVIVTGTLIILYDLYVADLITTLAISAYILYQGFRLMPRSINMLMEGTPEGIEIDAIVAAIENVDGVAEVHHLHVWQLNEQHAALEAHVVVARASLDDCEDVKRTIKTRLASDFGIEHATLETEPSSTEPADGHNTATVPPH